MKKTLFAVLLVSAAAVSTAQADDDQRCGNVPIDRWMSEQQIRERASALGLTVREVEIDDGCYDVKARDREGRRLEVRFHPQTGEQVSVDDD